MAFTWTGNPENSIIEQIRFEIGDIDSSDPLFEDAEIEFAYEIEETIKGASAKLMEVLSRRYAREADKKLGPLSVSASHLSLRYANLAKELRKEIIGLTGAPYVGGIYLSEDIINDGNTNIKNKIFDIDIMENK